MSKTPTLDKFGLHPFGGYCTCFSRPYYPCAVCTKAAEQKARWDSLSPEIRRKAEAELDLTYPPSSNQDGR